MKLSRVHAIALAGVVAVGGSVTAMTGAWGHTDRSAAKPAGSAAGLSAPMGEQAGIKARSHFTHATRLKRDCAIHDNYPKSGVARRTWSKAAGTRVGVRYTYKGYVLVLDYAKPRDPSWGFINRSCLNDPYPRSQGDRGTRVRQDLRAIGGGGALRNVPISAAHSGKSRRKVLHLDSAGSLRSEPFSFVIGNLRGPNGGTAGDSFQITRESCGRHGPQSWILGYARAAGRWGYVQAMHLPACR